MTPEFAKAVDPVFMYVLNLLDRIEQEQAPDPEEERVRIRGRLDQAEAMLGQGQDWQLAKYGLVSWIDEVLIDAPWPASTWWKENSLEWELFRSLERSEQFYLKAKEASTLRRKDALEVFYVAVVLGFRGLYRDPARTEALHEPLDLPADLETWSKQTSMAIELGRGIPPISDGSVPIAGAPPLDGPFTLIWASVAGVVLTVLAAILGTLFLASG
jgi:type VI secretion system protein ImpK